MLHTAVAVEQSSHLWLLGMQEVWESQKVACACPEAAICSAVSAAGGRNGRALLEGFPRQDAALVLNNPHVVVTQSHAWSPFREVRGQSLEIKSFTQPLLCLGEFFFYSAEVGKAGGQYMPRNSSGLLPPEPKPPTTCLQHNWCLFTCCIWIWEDVKEVK